MTIAGSISTTHECNYLQANEDSLHVQWLHMFLPGSKNRQGLTSLGRGQVPDPFFVLHCEDTHFGVRIFEFTDVALPLLSE